MSIVLRTNKGSALTYDEMDRNQSQFFYSSSLVDNGTTLRLHYTGSDSLDMVEGIQTVDYGPTRYQDIPFPQFDVSTLPQSNVAGQKNEIQFRDNINDDFGADSLFVFDSPSHSMGLGVTTPVYRLTIAGDASRSATIALSGGSSSDEFPLANRAIIKFFNTGFGSAALIGQLGKLQHLDDSSDIDDLFIHAGTEDISGTDSGLASSTLRKLHIALGDVSDSNKLSSRIGATFSRNASSKAKLGINTVNPTNILNVVGSSGIAISSIDPGSSEAPLTISSVIKPVGDEFYNQTETFNSGFGTTGNRRKLYPEGSAKDGIEIISPSNPNGGNVVVVLNTGSGEKEGFNIITTQQNNANNAKVLATFQGSGKVGIGTNFPEHTGLTIQEQLSIKSSTECDPFAEITKTLVADSTGLVKEVVAAPVPKGGIIMWSGPVNEIPEGWRLCKNGVGTVNNVIVPNLSNKFIIASSNATGTPTTTILGTGAASTGGSTSFQPAGTLTLDKLETNMLAPHTHMFLGDDQLYNGNEWNETTLKYAYGGGTGQFNSANDIDGYDASSNQSGNRQAYWTGHNNTGIRTTSTILNQNDIIPPTGAFTGTVATKAIIPPFYALAYIIYVGV